MPTFFPPTADTVPPIDHRRSGPEYWLFRHYKARACGRSVLKAADGTYSTVDTPTQDQIDASAVAYLGGHVYEVSADEAAALTAAGYGSGLS